MPDEIAQRRVGDGREFLVEGRVVGRLFWVQRPSGAHRRPGWWLESEGWPDERLSYVPSEMVDDPERARQECESASLGLAEQVLIDRLSGLLPRPRLPAART